MTYLAVIDVETTGLNPYRYDRIIEVSALVMQLDGKIIREFVTLINPERDIGPTSIHGLTASDVVKAPRFVEVAGMLLEVLSDCVAWAGHNIRFDQSFLSAEFGRFGITFPNGPTICTMNLAGGGTLTTCCKDYGITFEGDKHTALHDARATAQLLAILLRDAPQQASKIMHLTPITWPNVTKYPVYLLTRDEARRKLAEPPTYLQKLFAKAENDLLPETDDGAMLAYIALLDRVLEDRQVDPMEAQSLIDLAARWGIAGHRIQKAHREYLRQLTRVAWADGAISDTERRDLRQVAFLLGINDSEFDEILETDSRLLSQEPKEVRPFFEPVGREELSGKWVCFTGESQCRHLGQPITREMATELATNLGMIVVESVTKKLHLLVVSDPLSQSGKAKKARKFGIRIMHEIFFWRILGIEV